MKIPFILAALGLLLLTAKSFANPYQIGPAWGKKAYTRENRHKIAPHLKRAAWGSARFLGGSAFYLGKHAGKHVMATNYHVLPGPLNCHSISYADFPLIDVAASCQKVLVSLSRVELSLFTIKVSANEEEKLSDLGLSFSNTAPKPRELYGLGYGRQGNPSPVRDALLISHDSHCRPFAEKERLIRDPDGRNPVDYRVWSLPIGCDFSHGDSGAAVVDERGDLAGIFWTGGMPKTSKIKSARFLDYLLEDPQANETWEQLSYMVPLRRLRSALAKLLENEPGHPHRFVLQEMIEDI